MCIHLSTSLRVRVYEISNIYIPCKRVLVLFYLLAFCFWRLCLLRARLSFWRKGMGGWPFAFQGVKVI